jgi:hypothetical protein
MNILEEMNIEIGRASVAARLADTPEQINERYRMSRNGAIGTGVLFAATLASGQLWLPALLPLFAPSVFLAVYTRGFGIKLADKLFANNVQKWSLGAVIMLVYMISFAPLDALGWFFIDLDFRMPVVAALLQYGILTGALYFSVSRMQLYKHIVAAVHEKRADFSDN